MQFEEHLEKMRRLARQLESAGVFAQIRATQEALRSILIPGQEILAAVAQIQEFYAGLLQQIRLPDFEQWARAERQAAAILVARGWWPHPDWPAGVVHVVIRLKREGRIRELDGLICESYEMRRGRPMQQAVDRWLSLPEFKARRRIFKDGLWAYRRQKYGLAVTHWLPQVEGTLRSFAERRNLAQGSWKRVGQVLVGEHPDYMESFTGAFLKALRAMYDRSLPKGRGAPEASQFPVQRDAILHGVDLKFARRAYAMRIFLMLDTLHYFISSYEAAEKRAA